MPCVDDSLVGKSKRRVALLVGAAMYALEGVLVGARSSSRVMMALRRELLGGKKVADWLSSARLSSALYSAALAGVDIRFFNFAPVAFV